MSTLDWRHHAACRNLDGEIFFPISETRAAQVRIDKAKAICALCPVKDECFAWALGPETRQDYGVWGGTTGKERRKILRRTAVTP